MGKNVNRVQMDLHGKGHIPNSKSIVDGVGYKERLVAKGYG